MKRNLISSFTSTKDVANSALRRIRGLSTYADDDVVLYNSLTDEDFQDLHQIYGDNLFDYIKKMEVKRMQGG
jgi:hypothetical protein